MIKQILYTIENGYSSEEDIPEEPQKKLKRDKESEKKNFATFFNEYSSSDDEGGGGKKEREKRNSFSKFTLRRENDLISKIMSCKDERNMIMEEMTETDKMLCSDFLNSCKKNGLEIVKKISLENNQEYTLLSKHFVTLKPKGKMFDEPLNCFMSLLQNVDSALCGKNSSRRKSFFFSSYFFQTVVTTIFLFYMKIYIDLKNLK